MKVIAIRFKRKGHGNVLMTAEEHLQMDVEAIARKVVFKFFPPYLQRWLTPFAEDLTKSIVKCAHNYVNAKLMGYQPKPDLKP